MKTKLNKKVSEFFKLPKENIIIDEINDFFGSNDKNDYGNLLHAAVQYKYDEDKVLEFIKELLENNYDVNYKGKYTGYNFIQLALYGYTDDKNNDHSYSTEFILKLIKLAKKHNLDVNTKDNDGDSIIHTAIASEVYTGKILPILESLGKDFDEYCKDSDGNTIIQALDIYLKEAKKENKSWYERLIKEEKVLRERLEIGAYSLEDIEKQEKEIKVELENLINKININYLKENKDEILELKNRLSIILNKKSLLSKKENNFNKIWTKYNELIRHIFNTEINKLKEQNNILELKKLLPILEEYNYEEEIKTINLIIDNYYKELELLKNSIKENFTIKQKEVFLNKISKLLEEDKKDLISLIEELENKIISLVEEINSQSEILNSIGTEKEPNDLTILTIKELQEIIIKNKQLIEDKKQIIISEKKSILEKCIKDILALEETNAFELDELIKVIEDSTSNIPKKREKQKRKK